MTSAALLARTAQAWRTVRVDVVRVLLTLLALLPYVLGWVAGAAVTATAWTWAAVVVGWRDARRDGDG